jgi:hypothetical protein
LANPQPAIPPNVDILFSARGAISGAVAAQGPMYFLLRDLQDATDTTVNPWAVGAPGAANASTARGDMLIFAVVPQSGLAQTYEVDQTDNFTNPTTTTPVVYPGSGPPDGIADNLFNFAQQGRSAGR